MKQLRLYAKYEDGRRKPLVVDFNYQGSLNDTQEMIFQARKAVIEKIGVDHPHFTMESMEWIGQPGVNPVWVPKRYQR